MRIALIGAGRLATNLAPALKDAGHDVVQVYSRTQEAAETLAAKVGAKATCSVEEVTTDADVYIFSVSDNALPQLAKTLGKGREDAVFLHTAGSVAMSVFEGVVKHYGVLYPMQTFSKERMVNFKDIPVFVEGSDEQTLTTVRELAETVSTRVMELTSEGRRHLHLAAVFASNFVNHCYALSAEVLSQYDIPFSVMLPLTDEVAAKVHELKPVEAQTGPAVRYDTAVISAQQQLLADKPRMQQIYTLMSESIHYMEEKRKNSPLTTHLSPLN